MNLIRFDPMISSLYTKALTTKPSNVWCYIYKVLISEIYKSDERES